MNLFFPKNCVTCGNNLINGENIFCIECRYELPKTNYHKIKDNEISKIFWGIVNIKYATSLFFFNKGSKYQKAIHKLKYKGQKEIGNELGIILGSDLNKSFFSEIDLIIPVPLHPIKKHTRGYNQSEMIVNGLASSMTKKTDTTNLIRTVFTETQTKKTIEERRKNVDSVFKVINPKKFENKHILLVDDVITTGATIIACSKELLKIKNVKVSIATLAIAQ